MSRLYYVRMDSAVTGDTIAAGHILALDGVAARTVAEDRFNRRLTAADCAGMPEELVERILALDEAGAEVRAAGVTYHVRHSNAPVSQAINLDDRIAA